MDKSFIIFCYCLFFVIGACSTTSSNTESKRINIATIPSRNENDLIDEAFKAYDRGLYTAAQELFTELRDGYPSSHFMPIIELKLADSYYYSGDYAAAQLAYEEFIRSYSGHEATSYAQFQIANSFFNQFSDTTHDSSPLKRSEEEYTKLISNSAQHKYTEEAKKQLAKCREMLAEHDANIVRFYLKQNSIKAAAGRLSSLLKNFPDTQVSQSILSEIMLNFPEQYALLNKELSMVTNIASSSNDSAAHRAQIKTQLNYPALDNSTKPQKSLKSKQPFSPFDLRHRKY